MEGHPSDYSEIPFANKLIICPVLCHLSSVNFALLPFHAFKNHSHANPGDE